LFERDIERELYRAIKQASREIAAGISNKNYEEALEAVLPVAAPLDIFLKK